MSMGLYSGRAYYRRIFATEIWGIYLRERGLGYYGILRYSLVRSYVIFLFREPTRLSGKLLLRLFLYCKLKDRSFEIHFAMSDIKLPKPSIYTFVTSVTELLSKNRLTFLLLFDCSIHSLILLGRQSRVSV